MRSTKDTGHIPLAFTSSLCRDLSAILVDKCDIRYGVLCSKIRNVLVSSSAVLPPRCGISKADIVRSTARQRKKTPLKALEHKLAGKKRC